MNDPRNGQDFWTLVEYEWDPDTGTAVLLYEHDDGRQQLVTMTQDTYRTTISATLPTTAPPPESDVPHRAPHGTHVRGGGSSGARRREARRGKC